jgi:hypothetical protein
MFPDDHAAAAPKFHYPWPALKYLDLSKNDIAELSETFGYLTRLETLNLGRNKLSALSVALALLTRLKELELEMNPLSSPPMEIVSRGHEMVLLYLKRFDYIPGLDFTLSLPTLNLSQLPSDLRLYSSVLTSLDISNNCLETLQENVSVLHRLRELKAGHAAAGPIYDFATHSRRPDTLHVAPRRIIIVDGILIFHPPYVRELFDDMVFFDTPEELRYERRLKRDVEERGRTPEGVRAQFLRQVKPMHDQFVEPSKAYARTVVCDQADYQAALKDFLKKFETLP